MFGERRRCRNYEDDISAEEEIQSKGSWLQSKNEHSRRKKSLSCKKSKRKKSFVSIGRIYVAFFVKQIRTAANNKKRPYKFTC